MACMKIHNGDIICYTQFIHNIELPLNKHYMTLQTLHKMMSLDDYYSINLLKELSLITK